LAVWSFEIQQADGLSPVRALATATDITVQTPGLPLAVERSFSSDIVAATCRAVRLRLALGGGWPNADRPA